MPASIRPACCITPKRRTASRHSRLSRQRARASVESRGRFSGRSCPRSFIQGGRLPGGNLRPILESHLHYFLFDLSLRSSAASLGSVASRWGHDRKLGSGHGTSPFAIRRGSAGQRAIYVEGEFTALLSQNTLVALLTSAVLH